MTVNDDFWQFVERHKSEDPIMLRLKFGGEMPPWANLAITHIECVQKCGRKLGQLQPELMVSPLSVEQSTSEQVAHVHADIAARLPSVSGLIIDMTCGLGIDLSALSSRLGGRAIGVELNPLLAEAAAYNFRNNDGVSIICGDSVEYLKNWDGKKFDLIFIDPARRGTGGERVYNIHDCQPDLIELLPLLSGKCRYAMAKLSPMLDVTQTIRDLGGMSRLYVIEEHGECRELLALLDFTQQVGEPEIVVCTDVSVFSFFMDEEKAASANYGMPSAGDYLFEPSPAAMKARPFALLCQRHGLRKIHPNTNLFVSAAPVEGLPGKWYAISEVNDMSSSTIRNLSRRFDKVDIAVRNYPITPEQLHRKLKIKAGGNCRLMCCMVIDESLCKGRGVLMLLTRHHF